MGCMLEIGAGQCSPGLVSGGVPCSDTIPAPGAEHPMLHIANQARRPALLRPVRCVHEGTAGGEAQQADITQLLKELELKKAKLNELHGESRKAEADIARCRDDDTDAQRLTPDGCVVENNYIQVSRPTTQPGPACCQHNASWVSLSTSGVNQLAWPASIR